MEKNICEMNIFEKMSAIQQEAPVVGKRYLVKKSGNYYTAVSAADVIRAIKSLEAKYHVFSYPLGDGECTSATIYKKYIDYTTREEKQLALIHERVKIKYRFVNMDDPKEYIEVSAFGSGIDTGDKAPGMAMTYATKSALIHAYKLEQGDIDDPNASEDTFDITSNGDAGNGDGMNFMPVAETDMQPINTVEPPFTCEPPSSVGDLLKMTMNMVGINDAVETAVDDGLPHTIEEARAVRIAAGDLNGTIGELWDDPTNKGRILRYHATARAFARDQERYPEKVAALKIMLESEGITI